MTTSLRFPKPKDPADASWYQISFPEPLAAVLEVAAMLSGPAGQMVAGALLTPGDSAPAADLVVEQPQLSADGFGAAFRLTGGTPGKSYALTARVTTKAGNTLRRSAILDVTGL